MGDTEDPFIPVNGKAAFANPQRPEDLEKLERLLDAIPLQFQGTQITDPIGATAMSMAVELVGCRGGGQVMMAFGALPTGGPGALRSRAPVHVKGMPTGPDLATTHTHFYTRLTDKAVEETVAVDLLVAPAQDVNFEIATLSMATRKTGGDIYHYPQFFASRDGEQLHYDLSRVLTREAGYGCVVKLRVSQGLHVGNLIAPWPAEVEPVPDGEDIKDESTFTVARLTSDTSFSMLLQHLDALGSLRSAYLQLACMYTDQQGNRRIRTVSLRLGVTSSVASVFRYLDCDAMATVFMKFYAHLAWTKEGACAANVLVQDCVDIMHVYRFKVSQNPEASHLILPQAVKLLPLYLQAISKLRELQGSLDSKLVGLLRMFTLPVEETVKTLYPRVVPLMGQDENVAAPTGVEDYIHLPPSIQCSVNAVRSDGVYLVDPGQGPIFLTLGDQVASEVCEQLFGRVVTLESLSALTRSARPALTSETEEGEAVALIVQQIRKFSTSKHFRPLVIANEQMLRSFLVEDALYGQLDYYAFLRHIHKMVTNKVE